MNEKFLEELFFLVGFVDQFQTLAMDFVHFQKKISLKIINLLIKINFSLNHLQTKIK
jgi:hypothetical protein